MGAKNVNHHDSAMYKLFRLQTWVAVAICDVVVAEVFSGLGGRYHSLYILRYSTSVHDISLVRCAINYNSFNL